MELQWKNTAFVIRESILSQELIRKILSELEIVGMGQGLLLG